VLIGNRAVVRDHFIRLGVSPLSWVNEVLQDLGGNIRAETCLSEAAAAGYSGVELSRIFPKQALELNALLARYGLSFISGWYNGFLAERDVGAELEAVRGHASLLRDCGANVMVYGECAHMADQALDIPLSGRLLLPRKDFAAYGARLTEFAKALRRDYGLDLAYHHHLMMVAERLDEVRALMAATGPAVGLLLDTGHAAAAGFDYASLIEEFGPRINHIHLKDVRGEVMVRVRKEGLSFNEGVRAGMFTVPGDGSVDFAPLARFLGTGKYKGWLVVEAEQDPAKAPPVETVARAHRFVVQEILHPAQV
jgi:inosose dehydratase